MTLQTYEAHDKHFARIASYAILKDGEFVGKVAFKYPPSHGRLYCYLHIIGDPMVRGSATGYGYDKTSAAFHAATKVLKPELRPETAVVTAICKQFEDKGEGWLNYLQTQGLAVYQTI